MACAPAKLAPVGARLCVRAVAHERPRCRARQVCELDRAAALRRQQQADRLRIRPLQLTRHEPPVTNVARAFVTVDGCRLEYEWHSPSATAARTIVFLHEGLGSITQWRDFPAALCARTGCAGLVYNRRGYGGSDTCGSAPFSPGF